MLLSEPGYVRGDGQHIGYAWNKPKMLCILEVDFGGAGGTVEKDICPELRLTLTTDRGYLIKTWGDMPPF